MSVRSAADWQALATDLQSEFHHHLMQFLSIDSVEDMSTSAEGKPFGDGVAQALDYLLQLADQDGFSTRNLDGFAGVVEFGEGPETVGVLAHVDVVPAGDGWTHPPFQPYVHNGRIYARGAVDDKGPALAAYFALKAVRDSGLPLAKKIQFIIGTDEESGWLCVKHYGEKESFPEVGFSPDSEFPIVHAEKGQVNPTLELQTQPETQSPLQSLLLKSFQAGTRINMVPDTAVAMVIFPAQLQKGERIEALDSNQIADFMKSEFSEFLSACQLEGNAQSEAADCLLLSLKGKASHGAFPDQGTNAGTLLAAFLNGYSEWTPRSKSFLQFAADVLHQDHYGELFGVACEDEVTGKLTLNPGIFDYSAEGPAVVRITLRYPATASQEQLIERVRTQAAQYGWTVSELRTSNAHYVPKNHAAVETLQNVYREHTGQEAELLFSGGATYARCMKYGVAFGPLFPGREDTAHQKDEYMLLDDLVKSIGIYAQALYELCKADC